MWTDQTREKGLSVEERATDSIWVERLEYGKLCREEEGPIVGTVEHRQLSWSDGFINELLPYCEPSEIGRSVNDIEDLPKECPHGTVIRPILLSRGDQESQSPNALLKHRRVVPVIGRVRARPEDGEGGKGRLYTMARYAFARSGSLDPTGLMRAISATKMRGLTSDQAAKRLDALPSERPAAPEVDGLTARFLSEALIYVSSGVPISITSHVAENVFFNLVSALWWALPSTLRPHLSAGWGVSASLSGKLAVSYATYPAEVCASFDPHTERWRRPERVTFLRRDEVVSQEYFADRVIPGQYFVWHVFGVEPGTLLEISAVGDRSRAEDLLTPPPLDRYAPTPCLPAFDDPTTASVFRLVGWNAYNIYYLKLLERYLQGEEVKAERFTPGMGNLTFRAKRREAFGLVSRTLAESCNSLAANRAAWDMLSQQRPATFWSLIGWRRGPGSARLRLLTALLDEIPVRLLKALRRAVRRSEADDLPGEAAASLRRLLQQSLAESHRPASARVLALHERLLRSPRLPVEYQEWAKAVWFEIALSLLSRVDAGRYEACARLQDLTQSPGLAPLIAWAVGAAPTVDDAAAIARWGESYRLRFAARLAARWNEFPSDVAAQRDTLLDWIALARPAAVHDPLLKFYLDAAAPLGEGLDHIRGEIEDGAVPRRMLPEVALLALRRYKYISHHIHARPARWADVLKLWPPSAVLALWPPGGAPALAEGLKAAAEAGPTPRIKEEAQRLELRAAELDILIQDWLTSQRKVRPRVLRWHWRWVGSSFQIGTAGQAPLVACCKYLIDGTKTSEPLAVDDEIVSQMIKFIKLSHQLGPLYDRCRDLWAKEGDGAYLRLLLQVFPEADFEPSAQQLGALIPHRAWLRGHLRGQRLHPRRKRAFLIATRDAMSVDYFHAGDELTWKDEYKRSPIWFVFWKLPIKLQGSFAALKQFCGDDVEQGASICKRYLNGAADDREYGEALVRVFSGFIVPALGHAGLRWGQVVTSFTKGPAGLGAKWPQFAELILLYMSQETAKKILKKFVR